MVRTRPHAPPPWLGSQVNTVDFLGARLAVLNMPDGVRRLVTSKALDLRGRVIRSRLPRTKKVIVTSSHSRSR